MVNEILSPISKKIKLFVLNELLSKPFLLISGSNMRKTYTNIFGRIAFDLTYTEDGSTPKIYRNYPPTVLLRLSSPGLITSYDLILILESTPLLQLPVLPLYE